MHFANVTINFKNPLPELSTFGKGTRDFLEVVELVRNDERLYKIMTGGGNAELVKKSDDPAGKQVYHTQGKSKVFG